MVLCGYYLLDDVHRLCRKKEIDPVVNTPINSPINAAPANNPFDGHSVGYIEDVFVIFITCS